MSVDPQGWLVTLPLLAGMLWLACQSAEHPLKRAWRELMRREADALGQVVGIEIRTDSPARLRAQRLLFWICVAGLAAGSLASIATYLGLPGAA